MINFYRTGKQPEMRTNSENSKGKVTRIVLTLLVYWVAAIGEEATILLILASKSSFWGQNLTSKYFCETTNILHL